ncbi:MAG: peptidase M16 [Ignavibacteria bacterium RBG_16_34_14]|nr:MAG: peptidase M16 [Ignavibacteria bacterium RBG_16_34_14]
MRLSILILLLPCCLFPQSLKEDIKTIMLSNGMKILVLEDHSIPNANMYLFWKVGSRNEYPGITGLSHFFEHMMFNGSKNYEPKMFDIVMEASGGANNAYTSENVTVYTDWFPTSGMETIFKLESDRICFLNFDDEMIESERGVVLSERSTWLENSNYSLLGEQVQGTAFFAHPYRWPVIGYESDIKNWKKEDLQNYFKTYYAPNNCVVVISGDVTLSEVEKLSKKYFEPIPQGIPPRKIHTVEPEQLGEKRIVVKKEVASPNIMISYHVPESKSEEYYALSLLNSILSSGNTSRLYKSLVDEKQLATAVYTDMSYSFNPFLFTIYAICNDDVSPDTLENAVYKEIDNIIEKGITDEELQKVKNQKVMEFYKSLETINGKSNTIGTYELFFGDYAKLFEAAEEYKKVTPAEVLDAAKKYFIETNRTVGFLISPEEELQ